ncbi:hypothetical protein Tco_0008248 [Tanacetum coccineum]
MSSLETLIKQHNERAGAPITPFRITFTEEGEGSKEKDNNQGPEDEKDKDLKKPYKEIYDGSTDPDNHITRFVGAANQGEWEMPVWCRMFQQTLDGPATGWFDRMPNGCIDNWTDLREKFTKWFALRRKCSRDPTEVLKIIRLAQETLSDFKECWTEEMGTFKASQRVDDFVKSEEAYKSTELPKREHPERGQGAPYKGDRPPRLVNWNGHPRMDNYGRRDHYQPYVPPRAYDQRLDSLTKLPSEILTTEIQLQLPPCPLNGCSSEEGKFR